MGLTDDPNHPGVQRGTADDKPVPQHGTYLVLSEAERAKGYIRPVRQRYRHVGIRPRFPLRELTEEERERYASCNYVMFEAYPESESPLTGRYWTQTDLDSGCGVVTTMGVELAQTYARDPTFYGLTYCIGCFRHRPVAEFVWDNSQDRVGS